MKKWWKVFVVLLGVFGVMFSGQVTYANGSADSVNPNQNTLLTDDPFIAQLAEDTWAYLSSDWTTDNHLPWSWRAEGSDAGSYANPAEIGFYALSWLAAYDMQQTWSPNWAETETEVTAVLDQLRAWQSGSQAQQPNGPNAYGNSVFYRWYWIAETPPVVGQNVGDNHEVPSVDNAWLAASLISIREYAQTNGRTALAQKADDILADMDFSIWYHAETHRFNWGAVENPLGGDQAEYYSDENRIINFIARARGDLDETEYALSLAALAKPTGTYNGITVHQMAYDGSYFTYASPALFIREMEHAYGQRTLIPATQAQMAYASANNYDAWGISDSFDVEMGDYMLQGTSPAGLELDIIPPRPLEQRPGLIAPHASALTFITSLAPEASANLQNVASTFGCAYHASYGFHDSVMADPTSPDYGKCSSRFSALAQEWIFLAIANQNNGFIWNHFYLDPGVTTASDEMFGVPSGVNIALNDANPTNASTVTFTVTLSEIVTGVDKTDFIPVSTTLTGISVQSVVASDTSQVNGYASTYIVTVDTGSGNGTLGLKLKDNDTIIDAAGNPLGGLGLYNGDLASAETYLIYDAIPILLSPANATRTLSLRPQFSWTPLSGAVRYQIQISTTEKFKDPVLSTSTGKSSLTPGNDLPANTLFYWRVRAKIGGTYRGWSAVQSFTTPKPPSIPVLMSPANQSKINNYIPTLKWEKSRIPANTTFDHYRIQVSRNSKFTNLVFDVVVKSTKFVPPQELVPGAKYFWRVSAYNTSGEYSSWSEAGYFSTPPTIFDNGAWWIKKLSPLSPPDGIEQDPMKIYVNGKYWGKTHMLQIGHKKTDKKFPETAVIYSTGYIRLTPLGLPFGSSFILGPSHRDIAGNLFYNLQIDTIKINTKAATPDGPLNITFTGRDYNEADRYQYHFFTTHKIKLDIPTAKKATMTVQQTYTAAANFDLQGDLKIAELASMYLTANQHDGDSANHVTANEDEQLVWFKNVPCGNSFFDSPLSLSQYNSWIQLRHSDNLSTKGNTPNMIIQLTPSSFASRITVQGKLSIDCNVDPKNINVGYWLNDKDAPSSFQAGDSYTYKYLLISQDNPLLPNPGLVAPANNASTSTNRPNFTWKSRYSAYRYTIQASTSPRFTTLLFQATTSTPSYTPANKLPANKTIYWRVKAKSKTGSSGWSPIWKFIIRQ